MKLRVTVEIIIADSEIDKAYQPGTRDEVIAAYMANDEVSNEKHYNEKYWVKARPA